jgi:glycosyltransferase involved in cell wall biosynthesis
MKVAYVCADPGVPAFGCKGSSIHVQEILYAFIRFGAQVKLFATTIGGKTPPGLENMEVYSLPNFSGDREEFVVSSNRIMKETLEQAGHLDLVYERYSLWSFSAMEYAKSLYIPGLLEVNSPLIEEQAKYRRLPNRTLAEYTTKHVFQTASLLIAVSNEIAAYLHRFPCTHDKVQVVPNGVNVNRFPENLRATNRRFAETFTVGFIGTIKPWHGLPILVEAFDYLRDRVQNVRLVIVGDGPGYHELVKNLEDKNLLHSTEITGAVSPSEVPGLLSSMDVAVAPYPRLEHFYFSPLKVYEYMAAGLPVITSRIGQLVELIHDGVNGILVTPGDPLALAAALEKLYSDPKLCKRLGKMARQTMIDSHTWDAIVYHILDLSGFKTLSKPTGGTS